jgi:hypothetical protein
VVKQPGPNNRALLAGWDPKGRRAVLKITFAEVAPFLFSRRDATKLVSRDRRHHSSQDVHHRAVNSLGRYDRQSNEHHSYTGAEPIQNGL